jgi:ribosomal protein S18 acetylase RimI-like enzyme
MTKNASWRPLAPKDIPSLLLIASQIHPGLPERIEVFAERVKLFPEGCLALTRRDTQELVGYAISHPILHHQPPALDTLLGKINDGADQYYIHDLAILREYEGRGYAREAMEMLRRVAKRYESCCLVSVYGTASFWGRFGFVEVNMDDEIKAKLVWYGEDAVLMERRSKICEGVETRGLPATAIQL